MKSIVPTWIQTGELTRLYADSALHLEEKKKVMKKPESAKEQVTQSISHLFGLTITKFTYQSSIRVSGWSTRRSAMIRKIFYLRNEPGVFRRGSEESIASCCSSRKSQ